MKSSKKKHGHHHEKNAQAVLSLLVLLIAFSILLLFNNYQSNIFVTNSFKPFMVLTFVCLALLACLLYLVGEKKSSRK